MSALFQLYEKYDYYFKINRKHPVLILISEELSGQAAAEQFELDRELFDYKGITPSKLHVFKGIRVVSTRDIDGIECVGGNNG